MATVAATPIGDKRKAETSAVDQTVPDHITKKHRADDEWRSRGGKEKQESNPSVIELKHKDTTIELHPPVANTSIALTDLGGEPLTLQRGAKERSAVFQSSGAYDRMLLQEQSGSGPVSQSQDAKDRNVAIVMHSDLTVIPSLDWRTALSPTPSHRAHRFQELSLNLLHQCASSWALETHLNQLVREFNATKNEELLIEFSGSRSEFLRHLLTHLNQFWAVITGMHKTLLAECVSQLTHGEQKVSMDFVLRSKACFRDVHENKLVSLWTYNEHKQMISLHTLSLWLKSPNRRTCASVVFDPRADSNSMNNRGISNFNLWRGFRITKSIAMESGTGMTTAQLRSAIRPFLDHIRTIWCRGDREAYLYCLSWMASLVQRPWQKLGVAIVLQGQPGSGKGILITEFLAKIIGPHHFSHITGLDQICGQFNGPALGTACLVFADEVMCSANKHHAAKLKTLITESQHTIENKNAPSLSVASFANYIFSSNEEHVLPIEHKDRRYFALQTDNKFSGINAEKKAHFDQLLAVPVKLVAYHLHLIDLSQFNARQVPTTEWQRSQKLLSMQAAGVDTWLMRCIEQGQLPMDDGMESGRDWERMRSKAAVYEHYRKQAGAQAKSGKKNALLLLSVFGCDSPSHSASSALVGFAL